MDGSRRSSIIRFLYEAELLSREGSIVLLAGADLTQIQMDDGMLPDIDLDRTNLAFGHFARANLTVAQVTSCDLTGADFSGAWLTKASFDESKVDDELEYVERPSVSFRGAHLEMASFVDAVLMASDFRRAILVGADFTGAKLSDADFRGANLKDATITERQLSEAWRLEGATMPDGRRYSGSC